MKPTAVGSEKDLEEARQARDAVKLEPEVEKPVAEAAGGEGQEEKEEQAEESVEEDLLVLQDYVFDQDLKVGDILRENNMEITKFWRFECGEELMESKARQ